MYPLVAMTHFMAASCRESVATTSRVSELTFDQNELTVP